MRMCTCVYIYIYTHTYTTNNATKPIHINKTNDAGRRRRAEHGQRRGVGQGHYVI